MNYRRLLQYTISVALLLFVLANIVAFFHAYKFTHFADENLSKTQDPQHLTTIDKLQALVTGVSNPRPVADQFPLHPYKVVQLSGNKKTEGWWIESSKAKGSVVLFHGYSGEKSDLLERAEIFLSLGYNTLLVDFMGSGGSEGKQTTIGYFEARQVKDCFDYVREKTTGGIFLFGTSMGAVAILKALQDYKIAAAGVILECPFGSLYQTTCARFDNMGVPSFPMAALLVFWGGVQNGFWPFSHRPVDYAKGVTSPTLLLYGLQDNKVSREEIEAIYQHLQGPKLLSTYPLAGHDDYLSKHAEEWRQDVSAFIQQYESQ